MTIKDIRLNAVRLRKILKEGTGSQSQPQTSERLEYRPSSYEEYSFESGRVMLNGMDVLALIDGAKADVELLSCLAGAIDEYRRIVWDRYGTQFRNFNAQTQGILERLLNKMNQTYEEMSGGIRIQCQGGRVWINDIDPKVVLTLFLSNPNEERRSYLKSIQIKLNLILEGKAGKSTSHGVLEEIKRLHLTISAALQNAADPHTTPLLAAIHHLSSK